MNNLQALRNIFMVEKIGKAPTRRKYAGEWVEVYVAIGNDHTATISMPSDALSELLHITTTPCERDELTQLRTELESVEKVLEAAGEALEMFATDETPEGWFAIDALRQIREFDKGRKP